MSKCEISLFTYHFLLMCTYEMTNTNILFVTGN